MDGDLILTSQKLILSTNYMLFLYGLFIVFLFSLLNRYMNEVNSMDDKSKVNTKHKLYAFFIWIIYSISFFAFK